MLETENYSNAEIRKMTKDNENRRHKGSDKRKNTYKKYGKNTTRGLRIKITARENRIQNMKKVGKKILV